MLLECKPTLVHEKAEEKLLDEYFITVFLRDHILCQGCHLPRYFTNIADDILNFEVWDDDIWVCAFPKTGTTWVQEMVWNIANNVDIEVAKNISLPNRFPYFEISYITDRERLFLEGFLEKRSYCDSVTIARSLPRPRFIKCHLPFQLLPLQLQQGTTKAKVIYISRNPKDTCISYYHHLRTFGGCNFASPLEGFATLFVNDAVVYGPFWSHVLGFWERRTDPNILFLKYEELQQDLPSVIRKTAGFLGKQVTDWQVNILSDHLSFDNMRNNKAVNYEEYIAYNTELPDEDKYFIRRGKVGDWKTRFSPEMIRQFDEWIKKNLKGTDYIL